MRDRLQLDKVPTDKDYFNPDVSITEAMTSAVRISQNEQGAWEEDLLAKLLRERRKLSKQERLAKFRNDSVDEVDTTDLENWQIKPKRRPLPALKDLVTEVARAEGMDEELIRDHFFAEEGDAKMWKKESTLDFSIHEDMQRLILRHRLNLARLYLHEGNDKAYTLRKFKKIFKREMAENPEMYVVSKKQVGTHPFLKTRPADEQDLAATEDAVVD